MRLTKIQYKKLSELMPITRKMAKISNYKFMREMLYIIENIFKWSLLPKRYGKWRIVYMKFNRWSKNSTISKAVTYLLSFFKTLF